MVLIIIVQLVVDKHWGLHIRIHSNTDVASGVLSAYIVISLDRLDDVLGKNEHGDS